MSAGDDAHLAAFIRGMAINTQVRKRGQLSNTERAALAQWFSETSVEAFENVSDETLVEWIEPVVLAILIGRGAIR